jgi:hypothetical protein
MGALRDTVERIIQTAFPGAGFALLIFPEEGENKLSYYMGNVVTADMPSMYRRAADLLESNQTFTLPDNPTTENNEPR